MKSEIGNVQPTPDAPCHSGAGRPGPETLSGLPRQLRVLIVDDHLAAADTMSMLVRVWGHDVWQAYDGTSGLELAIAYQPDVLLLDIMMPQHEWPGAGTASAANKLV